MDIEFGWSLDGTAWADAGVRTGPRGLLQLLQGRLGLTRPQLAPAVRTARAMTALAAADDPWSRASFTADPWATAAALLRARDAAVEAGAQLTPGPQLPARIAAITALDEQLQHAPGPADDLREVVDLLAGEADWPLGIEQIRCHEDPAALPGLWPALFAQLTAAGVRVERIVEGPTGQPELLLIEAEDEWTAAEAAARFLAGHDRADGAGLQVLATTGTVLLDQELHRRDLPALGIAAPSADRTAGQIIGLFLSIAVAPVDVQQLAAFLDLRVLDAPEDGGQHVGLVPARVRRQLLAALEQEPGVGGPAWRAALATLEADPDLPESAREVARWIDRTVTAPLETTELTPTRLLAVLEPLGTRLHRLGQGDPELLRAATHLQVLREVLEGLQPQRPLAPRELTRIIGATGGRSPSPFARPEAGAPWRSCARPAQLLPTGGAVLWWGAERPAPSAPVQWDPQETAALTRLGAHLLPPAQLAALETDAGLRALRGARRIIAVRAAHRCEEPTAPHPLLAHLAAESTADGGTVEKVLEARTRPAADTVGPGSFHLAGAARPLSIPPRTVIPPRPADLTRTAAPAPHLLPRSLSYSQAETLLGCRQKWVYRHGLRIRPATGANVPTGNQMVGTLVHAVVEELVRAGAASAPSTERIRAEFTAQVPRLASELLLPGREAELAELRERAVRSLREFFDRLAAAGITITAAESGFERPLTLHLAGGEATVPFRGFRDVDAHDADGRPVVIDLKWTYAAKKYPDLFDTGEALQLASYAWSLGSDSADGAGTDVGYFLLSQGEFVSANPLLDPAGRTPLPLTQLWEKGRTGMEQALEAIRAGAVGARSGQILLDAGQDLSTPRREATRTYERAREAAASRGELVVDARCDYCDLALLCGLAGDRS